MGQLPERRELFRIDEDVIFDVHPVDANTALEGDPATAIDDGPSWHVLEQLAEVDLKQQTALQTLAKHDPNSATCLRLLNDKLDLIARHTVFSSYQHLTKTRISLGEQGIAFKSSRVLYKSSYVVIRIIFLPNFSPLLTFAQIIRCESHNQESDERFKVAAKFIRLTDKQIQRISKILTCAQQTSTV